jgi:hypothetical protein
MILVSHWTCDRALAALFTPARPEVGRYEVCITADPLAASVEQGAADGVHFGDVQTLEAFEAFGAAGPYNRTALARLYGGTRVHVARGWARRDDRFESVTLLSPYPNPSLVRLDPGTMAIRWILDRGL